MDLSETVDGLRSTGYVRNFFVFGATAQEDVNGMASSEETACSLGRAPVGHLSRLLHRGRTILIGTSGESATLAIVPSTFEAYCAIICVAFEASGMQEEELHSKVDDEGSMFSGAETSGKVATTTST